jgi:glycosyltransferase involved in cell wall biosynthesis
MILKDGENCILTIPSPQAMAEKLGYAVMNFEDLSEIRKNGYNLVHNNYSNWESAFEPVAEFFKACIYSKT